MVGQISEEQVKALDSELADAFRQTLTEMMDELPAEEQEMMQDALDSGAQSLSEALYIEPGTVNAMCQIGNAFYEAGRYEQAQSIFSLITSLDEHFFKAWRGLGAIYQVNKNYDMAVSMYRQAVFHSANSGRADVASKILLGEALMLSGDKEEGRAVLTETVEIKDITADEMPFVRRAKIILQMGDKPQPQIMLVRGGQPLVNKSGLEKIIADVAAVADSPAELITKYFEELLAAVPDQELALLTQAALDGKSDLAAVYDVDKATLAAICQIGNSFYEIGQYNKATPIFSMLTIISPDYNPAWRGLGAIFQVNKQYDLAKICYLKAVTAAEMAGSKDIPSLVLLGEVDLHSGAVEDGTAALNAALATKAQNSSDMAYQRRAKVLLKIGQKPAAPQIVFLKGEDNQRADQSNVKALGLTESVLKSVDSIADLDNYIAELFNKTPDEEIREMALAVLAEGATQLREVYHVDMDTMAELCQMANSFYQVGDYHKAATLFGMLTNLDLEYGPAWRGLGAIKQVEKDYQLAEFYYRRAIMAAENNHTRDIPSTVFLAEVLALANQKVESFKILKSLNDLGDYKLTKEDMAYIHRAQILKQGTSPTKLVVIQGKKRAAYLDEKLTKAVEAVSIEENALDKNAEMYLQLLNRISDDELTLIMNAVRDGATNMAEAYGIDKTTLNSICQIGYSYYEAGRYGEAGPVLGLVTMLDPTNVIAWRGLGAILQAQKNWQAAADTYSLALNFAEEQDIVEIPALVLKGECLIFGGQEAAGREILEKALKIDDIKLQDQAYIARAKALLQRGSNVQPIIIMEQGHPVGQTNTDIIEGRPSAWTAEDREITAQDILAIPELHAQAQEILRDLGEGRLNLAQVAGFPQANVDALYKAAVVYANNDEYENALLIASFVFMLDPHNERNVMFMATVMMRMKNYAAAEELMNIAIPVMKHDNPLYELNIGETKLMLGNKDEGAGYLHKCIELCGNKPEARAYASRANQLLKLYVEH